MKKGEVITNSTEIQIIIRDYYEQLYANKIEKFEEMGNFLERYNLPGLNQEKIENMNRPITGIKIEIMIKIFQQNKSQRQDSFTD